MSITAEVPGSSPVTVLADAVAAVRGLADVLWSARSDDELVEVVGQVQQLTSALAAVEADAVAEADARDLAKQRLHYGSTGDWLTHIGGLRRGEGKRRLVRARALTGPLTRTRDGLVAGAVSPEQADVIVRSVEDLPSGDLVRRRGEKVLLRQAKSLDASDLTRAGRHLAEVVDPDAVDRRLEAALEREERAAHLNRFLSVSEDRAGGIRVRGCGSAEDGALLMAALLPLTCPAPATDPETGEEHLDPRDHGARLWDALVATAQHALDTDLPPETHGTPARLLVTLDHQTLTNDLEATASPPGSARPPTAPTYPPTPSAAWPVTPRLIPAVLGSHGEVLDVGRTRRLVTDTHLDRPGHPGPALHLPRLQATTTHVSGPPPHPLDIGRRNQSRQSRPALRASPPRHPPHTLGNTPQPDRPKTRIPATTHTRKPSRVDPISPQTRVAQGRHPGGGSSPVRPSTDSRIRSAWPVCRPYSSSVSRRRRRKLAW